MERQVTKGYSLQDLPYAAEFFFEDLEERLGAAVPDHVKEEIQTKLKEAKDAFGDVKGGPGELLLDLQLSAGRAMFMAKSDGAGKVDVAHAISKSRPTSDHDPVQGWSMVVKLQDALRPPQDALRPPLHDALRPPLQDQPMSEEGTTQEELSSWGGLGNAIANYFRK